MHQAVKWAGWNYATRDIFATYQPYSVWDNRPGDSNTYFKVTMGGWALLCP